MKQWACGVFLATVLGGLAYANQITLDCITEGPANSNFWTTARCYEKNGVLTLVTLSLSRQSQDSIVIDTSDSNTVVDTRTVLEALRPA